VVQSSTLVADTNRLTLQSLRSLDSREPCGPAHGYDYPLAAERAQHFAGQSLGGHAGLDYDDSFDSGYAVDQIQTQRCAAFDLRSSFGTQHLLQVARMQTMGGTDDADVFMGEGLTGGDVCHSEQ